MNQPINSISELDRIAQSRWDSLSTKKIFFGHQSVGVDIISGLNDIMRRSPKIHLAIRRTRAPRDFNQPIFAESFVGVNTNPKSKVDDFKAVMKSGVGNLVDIAFFKFCYVDFDRSTDVRALFQYYETALSELKNEFPKVTFIHCTAPLTTMKSGIVGAVKKLLGRGGDIANMKREEYNRLLRDAYGKEGLVFDIARLESTLPNGARSAKSANGRVFYGLQPAYTGDGGHLNQTGRAVVARGLLELLGSGRF